jgi:hypothetical protein
MVGIIVVILKMIYEMDMENFIMRMNKLFLKVIGKMVIRRQSQQKRIQN